MQLMLKVQDKTPESRVTPYNSNSSHGTNPYGVWENRVRETYGKDVNVLVVTDHFTCYAKAFVTLSQMAKVVSQILWDKYFVHYGLPEKIISEQGKNFESSLIEELCALTQVKKLGTSPCHLKPMH